MYATISFKIEFILKSFMEGTIPQNCTWTVTDEGLPRIAELVPNESLLYWILN
jgi:hypothetical protein